MNKKNNPDEVRNINQTFRLNKKENGQLLDKAKEANQKPSDFLRALITDSIIIETVPKKAVEANEKLLSTLLEYKSNFKRLTNLIRAHDPRLNMEIESLVKSIQQKIDRL